VFSVSLLFRLKSVTVFCHVKELYAPHGTGLEDFPQCIMVTPVGPEANVYNGDDRLRGDGTGEESLDLMLVMKRSHQFPLHPDRFGDERDFMRRRSIKPN
jgi:hypothetical protein